MRCDGAECPAVLIIAPAYASLPGFAKGFFAILYKRASMLTHVLSFPRRERVNKSTAETLQGAQPSYPAKAGIHFSRWNKNLYGYPPARVRHRDRSALSALGIMAPLGYSTCGKLRRTGALPFQGISVLAMRKPKSSSLLSAASILLRLAERRKSGSSYHEPPRTTWRLQLLDVRADPSAGAPV